MKLLSNVIHCDPDIMGGIPVFVGTRLPIRTLLDYLEAGDSLDIFLDHFPSVSSEQAITVTRRINQKQSYNSPTSSVIKLELVRSNPQ